KLSAPIATSWKSWVGSLTVRFAGSSIASGMASARASTVGCTGASNGLGTHVFEMCSGSYSPVMSQYGSDGFVQGWSGSQKRGSWTVHAAPSAAAASHPTTTTQDLTRSRPDIDCAPRLGCFAYEPDRAQAESPE